MEWYYIAALIVYAVIAVTFYRQFTVVFVPDTHHRFGEVGVNIGLAVTWPLWLPVMLVIELCLYLRGK